MEALYWLLAGATLILGALAGARWQKDRALAGLRPPERMNGYEDRVAWAIAQPFKTEIRGGANPLPNDHPEHAWPKHPYLHDAGASIWVYKCRGCTATLRANRPQLGRSLRGIA